MRRALKTIDDTRDGTATTLRFASENTLLDPAGVIFVPGFEALIVSDLHLEKGSSFARRGQFLPPYDTLQTLARLSTLAAKYQPKIIISLGDSFHDDQASERLGEQAIGAIERLAMGRQIVWVTGNHDPSPPKHLPGDCAQEIALGDAILRHIPEPSETGFEISGHLHPCAKISVRGKNVRRPCFACDGTRMIMPSFGVMTGGLDLAHNAFGPLLNKQNLRAYMQGQRALFAIAAKDIVGI